MQTRYVLALVIVAVLATVAIEETRIARLQAEIIRLRELPPAPIPAPTPAPTPEPGSRDIPTESAAAPDASGPDPPSPAAPSTDTPPTGRQLPPDFPEPDENLSNIIALGPNSALYYELNLTNRERAYLEDLIQRRAATEADFAMKWMAASPEDRSTIEIALTPEIEKFDKAIAAFLNNDVAFATFQEHQRRAPERGMVDEIRPLIDQDGISLELQQENQLTEALYQARIESNSINWNAPEALPVIAEGNAPELFETQWNARTELLTAMLPDFLSEEEATAVLKARAQLKEPRLESVRMATSTMEDGLAPAGE